MAGVLLLGATDLTAAIAGSLYASGQLAGIVSTPPEFAISYSTSPVRNSRHVELEPWCRDREIPFQRYTSPNDIRAAAAETGAACALVAGWYHFVPAAVRSLFLRGCLAFHASLLPRYRGGAPLTWALLNGDAETGVTLFALTDAIDAGAIYDQRRCAIASDAYVGEVVKVIEALTLAMVREAIPEILSGRRQPRPQEGEPSYSLQREPGDGVINWSRPAADTARLVRAVSRPYPGARTALAGEPVIIWRARVAESASRVYGVPGQIVSLDAWPSPAVVTGEGLLLLEEIEGAGGLDVQALRRFHQRRFANA